MILPPFSSQAIPGSATGAGLLHGRLCSTPWSTFRQGHVQWRTVTNFRKVIHSNGIFYDINYPALSSVLGVLLQEISICGGFLKWGYHKIDNL